MKFLRKLAILTLLLIFAFSSLLPAPGTANTTNCDIRPDGVLDLADIGEFAQLYFAGLAGTYDSRVDFFCDGEIDLADLGDYVILCH